MPRPCPIITGTAALRSRATGNLAIDDGIGSGYLNAYNEMFREVNTKFSIPYQFHLKANGDISIGRKIIEVVTKENTPARQKNTFTGNEHKIFRNISEMYDLPVDLKSGLNIPKAGHIYQTNDKCKILSVIKNPLGEYRLSYIKDCEISSLTFYSSKDQSEIWDTIIKNSGLLSINDLINKLMN